MRNQIMQDGANFKGKLRTKRAMFRKDMNKTAEATVSAAAAATEDSMGNQTA